MSKSYSTFVIDRFFFSRLCSYINHIFPNQPNTQTQKICNWINWETRDDTSESEEGSQQTRTWVILWNITFSSYISAWRFSSKMNELFWYRDPWLQKWHFICLIFTWKSKEVNLYSLNRALIIQLSSINLPTWCLTGYRWKNTPWYITWHFYMAIEFI